MEYRIKLTVIVGGQSHAEALKRLQDAIEPPNSERISNQRYIETIDKVEKKETR